jgi:O-methyltransferase domain
VDEDVERLYELVDLITPMAIRVAATLRLADRIAAGTTALSELAAEVDADPDALGRLLRYLVARDVFAEPEAGRFTLTAMAETLLDDHPGQVRGWLDLTGAIGRADLAFSALLEVVRTGKPGHPMVHGRDFWADLAGDPGLTASFDALMAKFRAPWAQWLAGQDWSGTKHVVDVGAGTATLVISLLMAHPHLRGTLVEQPATAAAAEQALAEAGLSTRCDVVVGSFFDPLPAGADTYLLSSVLHDWSDADATAILRRCAQAAGPDGRVLLGEHVATGDEDRQMFTHMDMRMLVYLGGRERTLQDFEALTDAVGLTITSVTPAAWGESLITCTVR